MECASSVNSSISPIVAEKLLQPCTPLNLLSQSREILCQNYDKKLPDGRKFSELDGSMPQNYNIKHHFSPEYCDCDYTDTAKPTILDYCKNFDMEKCSVAIFCKWKSNKCVQNQNDFDEYYVAHCYKNKTAIKIAIPILVLALILVAIGVYKWVRYREKLSQKKRKRRAENYAMQKNFHKIKVLFSTTNLREI